MKNRKVARLRASADERKRPRELPDWPGYFKPIKKPVTLRIDADVLAWLKKTGARVSDQDQSGAAEVDDGGEEESGRVREFTLKLERMTTV